MPIYQVDVSLVAAGNIGARICPPDVKRRIDEDAELFSFNPGVKGVRALNAAEVSLLQRGKIELVQKPDRPPQSAGINKKMMIVSSAFAALIEGSAPGSNQLVPLDDGHFRGQTSRLSGATWQH